MMASTGVRIRIVSGSPKGRVYDVDKNIVTVGRDSTADIQIQDDQEVAPVHLEIQRRGAQFVLLDRSGRGTIVDAHRIDELAVEQTCQLKLSTRTLLVLQVGIDASATSSGRKSLLRRPSVLVGSGIYLLAVVSVWIFLSGTGTQNSTAVNAKREVVVVQDYLKYLERNKQSQPEEMVGRLQSSLRSAHLAEKSGEVIEAQRIYIAMLAEQTQDSAIKTADKRSNPVYRYALERLQALK